jgi:protein O-mannosyl-transferase
MHAAIMQMPVTPSSTARPPYVRRDACICVFLALVTLALYRPVSGFNFNNYDDAQYITENPQVQSGLTAQNLRWAFTTGHASNWHPLTWLSHMLDCQLFGLNPAGPHLVNVLFHITNTLLLFGLLRCMTGAAWRAAFVAALFALHPMHVESVAWVAERKDVLSAFFGLLTLCAWCAYVRIPSWQRYTLALFLFALGLMSKPMLVTLPLLMLLLDFWPLRRVEADKPLLGLASLVAEKIPFFALALVSCIVTFLVQKAGGAVMQTDMISPGERVANALISYVRYLGKLLWPQNLAVVYPYPVHIPGWQVAGAALLLAAITIVALRSAPRRPWLMVGWLWFVISLVPVIGLVQVGVQSMADRYTYLPAIGLFLMLTWTAAESLAAQPFAKPVLAIAAGAALAACFVVSSHQLQYWRNSFTLFTHALEVNPNNAVAHCNLGQAFAAAGKPAQAREHYARALEIDPTYVSAMIRMSSYYNLHGNYDQAVDCLEPALKVRPDDPQLHYNLALALSGEGKTDQAAAEYRATLALDPRHDKALVNLGATLAQQGDLTNAVTLYQRALEIAPGNPYAHNALGSALESLDNPDAAAAEYSNAVALQPDFLAARNNLAGVLAHQGKWDAALAQYSEILRLNPNLADAHAGMGVILAQTGNYAGAIEHYRAALQLNPNLVTIQKYLAWLLATAADAALRNGPEAVQFATGATRAAPDDPAAWDALAAAQAEAGDFTNAVAAATKGIDLANASQQTNLAARYEGRLKLYQVGQPFHAPPTASAH